MNRINYPDREMLMMAVANAIIGDLRQALSMFDRASLSIPGGTTPGPVFDILSSVDLDWDRVDVVLNDERWVPESSPRSNMALVRERLIQGQAAKANLIPLYADFETPEDGLPSLINDVENALPINVLLLGMGADMHTASLFPGADQLELALSDKAPALLAMRAPGAPEPRITLSAPVLKGADAVHILVAGAEKDEALALAERTASAFDAPIKTVLDLATIHWAP